MATTLQFRRGTTAEADSTTGSVAELFVDTENSRLRLHDGVSAGGTEIPNMNDLNTKQDALVSGTNIKTINGGSILAAGDLTLVEAETVTSISYANNTLTFIDEEGTSTDIDLSSLIDDTNLARIESASLSSTLVTFTRDDASTFSLDLADLISGKVDAITSTANAVPFFTDTTGQLSDSSITTTDGTDLSLASINATDTATVENDLTITSGNLIVNAGVVQTPGIDVGSVEERVNTNSVSVTDETVIDSYASTDYNSGKVIIRAKNESTSEIQITEHLIVEGSILETSVLFSGASRFATYGIIDNAGTLEITTTQTVAQTVTYVIDRRMFVA